MKKPAFPVVLAVLVLACGARTGDGSRRSSQVITLDEIEEATEFTAYDVIRRLRPQWLVSRSAPTPSNPTPQGPVVYVDGIRRSGLGVLQRLRRDEVVRMEYLSPSDATNRYGTDHGGGAILVTTG